MHFESAPVLRIGESTAGVNRGAGGEWEALAAVAVRKIFCEMLTIQGRRYII